MPGEKTKRTAISALIVLKRHVRAFLLVPAFFFTFWSSAVWCQQAEPPTAPAARASLEVIRIVFVGDVLMEADWRQPAISPAELFASVRDVLSAADIAVCNLESPLTDWPHQTRLKSKALIAACRDYILRVRSPDAALALRDAGIDLAALANNHTMDYGERGIFETMERLRDAGLLYVGAGATRAEAERTRIVEVRGLRIAFLSFSDVVPPGYAAQDDWPGIASAKDVSRLTAAIERARPEADFLIVIFHWGVELERMPSKRQMDLARISRAAGADVILGSHPHVLQPVGCTGKTPVVYSAGNFVFPTSRDLAQRSAVFEIEVTREEGKPSARAVRVVPTMMDADGRTRLAATEEAAGILREMGKGAAQLGARLDGDVITCTGAPVVYKPKPTTPRRSATKTSPRKAR
jgi:poly-gamma-glutamate capsule biosynthesis protein CapA/YwtB (metallophosphatase superfamily)